MTESGIIIANRPIPFRFVREIWLCIPDVTHRRRFAEVEKILDYELEDEVCINYHKSPIAYTFKGYRKLERLMVFICDLPHGPHDAIKERYISRLAVTWQNIWTYVQTRSIGAAAMRFIYTMLFI